MKRVVIIEDDMLLAMVEERLLTKLGYEVIGKAASGSKGLKLIRELKPDIVLTDHHLLDDMSGLDVVKALRAENNAVPVLFLSGESSSELREKVFSYDCVDCLFKPVTMETLKKPLKEASMLASEIEMYAA